MVKDIQQASRQLNKRQMTWFRDDPMYLWLDAKQPVDKLVDQIASSLAEATHIGMFWSVGVMCVSSMCCFNVSAELVLLWHTATCLLQPAHSEVASTVLS